MEKKLKQKRPRVYKLKAEGELVFSSSVKYNLRTAVSKVLVTYNPFTGSIINSRIAMR